MLNEIIDRYVESFDTLFDFLSIDELLEEHLTQVLDAEVQSIDPDEPEFLEQAKNAIRNLPPGDHFNDLIKRYYAA